MASSSSSSSRNWRYHVFPSFCGQDVRKAFLSHFLEELKRKGIITFIDNEIKRSESIAPELVRAIRESRIAIVVLSENYASSSWCLNELLEIMDCREDKGQIVMTIFYEVDPSHVRKQIGEFGKAFDETCSGKTEEQKQRWSRALRDVANIAGEDSRNWDNEAHMIRKIATDVSNELNSTPSQDFDDFVGIGSHVRRIKSLLCLESDEVRMVGIWGPAGIGKTTIARALYSRLSKNFQHRIFMENVKGCYRETNLDNFGLKLHLQKKFLSKIVDHKDMETHHLGMLEERLKYLRVLIVLDDVDNIEQLDALANQTRWFGPGSRIIVTTEDKKLLKAHGIELMYKVDFPSKENALKIFCLSAFRQNSPPDGFHDLAVEVADLAGNLPLGLRVLGSNLRGMSEEEWTDALPRLRSSLNGEIETVLRVGYDGLDKRDKAIYLHISCLFNRERVERVKQLLENSDLNVNYGLKELEDKSLIHTSRKRVEMHHLLQKMGREIVRGQSDHEPGKRQFLVDAEDIYDVFTDNTGTGTILGIDLNTSELTEELYIYDGTFEKMQSLQFLRFYKNRLDGEVRVNLPQGLQFLPRKLRLLHWHSYPLEYIPSRFRPQFLVHLKMTKSKLKKLWDGPQPLPNLKQLNLSRSKNLEQIPDLSNATRIEELILKECNSLVMLSSSLRNLKKLKVLDMSHCANLESLPRDINLESLDELSLHGCFSLRSFPEISSNIKSLNLNFTAISEVPSSLRLWSHLETMHMSHCENLETFPYVPSTVQKIYLGSTGIEEVPSWVENLSQLNSLSMTYNKKLKRISPSISKLQNLEFMDFSGCENLVSFPAEIFQSSHSSHHLRLRLDHDIQHKSLPACLLDAATYPVDLHLSYNGFESVPGFVTHIPQLRSLDLRKCRNLKSLPELPDSLLCLDADGCESLQSISCSFRNPEIVLIFSNCLKLDQEARELLQRTVCLCRFLPGDEVPSYFPHRAKGSSLTLNLDQRYLSEFLQVKVCVLLVEEVNSFAWINEGHKISCRFRRRRSSPVHLYELEIDHVYQNAIAHLCILDICFSLHEDNYAETDVTDNEMLFEFRCKGYEITECGVRILKVCSSSDDMLVFPKIVTRVCEEEDENDNTDEIRYDTEESESSEGSDTDADSESLEDESENSDVEMDDGANMKRCGEDVEEIETSAKHKRPKVFE